MKIAHFFVLAMAFSPVMTMAGPIDEFIGNALKAIAGDVKDQPLQQQEIQSAQPERRQAALEIMERELRWWDFKKGGTVEEFCAYVRRGRVLSDLPYYQDCESINRENIDLKRQQLAGAEKEKQRIDDLRNSKTRMCYQGICLQDPISKLSLPVTAQGNESRLDIRSNPKLLDKAKSLFKGISSADVELLAARGYAEGETKNASQQTLNSLKGIKTLCGKPTMFASVQVMAGNGKKISVVYSPMTMADGTSNYGVAFIGVPFPEIQSNQEMDLLIQKASETMNVPLKCRQLGVGNHCHNYAEDQEFNIEGGYAQIMQSRRFSADHYFDLNKAEAHPLCKSEVTF